ncbi:MAG: ferredoxin [Candidatus Latescibacteria bacterium]|nr:ferredoxin [Candidatus Latescibacterota bacterium]
MKMKIDPDLCSACGLCTDICSDVFGMGDEIAEVIADPVPADKEDCAVEAEESCPVGAISHE